MRWCASKDAGPQVGGLGSHINWRRERMPARTLGSEGGWSVRSHIGETFFIRAWNALPNICILKTLRGTPKGKTQRR